MAQLTPSDLDPGQVRSVTERVLAGPEYRSADPGLLAQGWRWLLDRVSAVLDAIATAGGGRLGLAILLAMVAVVALIGWRLVRRVRRDRGGRPRPDGIGGRAAQDWRQAAARAEAAGQWPEALRCHYRALLADLITAGLIDEVAGRTARGYLADVATAAPDAAPAMATVTDAFEAAWYDRRPVTGQDVAGLRDAAGAVLRRTPVPA